MHHRPLLRFACKCLAGFLFFLAAGAEGQERQIQLRNGTIFTPPKSQAAVAAMAKAAPVSGLFLIQFETAPDAAALASLRAEGVELIRYVPDDAFIARFKRVSPESVAQLNAVRWTGSYRSEYKVHPKLAAEIAGPKAKTKSLAVSILLSPDASQGEVRQLRGLLAKTQHESRLRLGTIIQAEVSSARLESLAQSDIVLWIEPAPKRKLFDELASKIVGGDDGAVATPALTQQLGFDGSGITVCVADTGLDTGDTNSMHPDLDGRVTGFQFYGDLTDGSDGHGHGTHCAGIIAGNAATGETDPDTGALYGLGIAPGANIFTERLFDDTGTPANPFPANATITRDAVQNGAKIGSNSWGNDTQGEYDLDAMQFDELVRDADNSTSGDQPYVLEFSAGNAGPASQTIGSPATAKNVIATGASQNIPGTLAMTYGLYAEGPDAMADFSSRGPCADGRIKPDVVAPGTWIASAASSYALDPEGTSWTVIDDYYVFMGGTSMAGPYAAGAAAVFMQYYQATHTNAVPSPALVKAALINSAEKLDETAGGPGPVPNHDEGWGRITLTNIITTNAISAPRFYQYLDQTVLLTNSQTWSQHLFVQSADAPLKITLAYTDEPGFPGAIPALVNDLDLEVVGPDGALYRGNQFGAGESVANAPSPDKLNNVEGVYLAQPAPGDYLVRVRASRVVQDAITNTPGIVDQDFALVSSADFVRPGTGFILLDRSAYTAPSTMNISVFDAARAGNGSVNVTVTNLTAHTFVTKAFNAAGNYGVFTSTVATVTGTAGAGQIQIANGNNLAANYLDASGVKRTASAAADLIAPAITSASAGTDLGVVSITWQTPEPATSIVRYGTNSANLNLGVTNLALVTDHVVKLTGLIPGKQYYYVIVSADAAGNTATNNTGLSAPFTGVTTPTVLLVDAYDTAWLEANSGTPIPDSAYTNVLAAAGINFAFWKVNTRGGPQLADLKPFPIVIWRVTDDAVNYGYDADGFADPTATNNTLNAQQQYMIQSYLNGGGSFFMASMDILSRLGNAPFRRNVLQVAGFTQNTSLLGICPDCDEDHGVPSFFSLPDTLAAGMSATLNYTNYPYWDVEGFSFGPDVSDTFTPASDATAITYETDSGRPCGMSYPNHGVESPGRVVFLSFPLDAMPTNTAVALLKNLVKFLAPGANGIGAIALDGAVYTTNDLVTVEVGDSDLKGAGQLQVNCVASSRTNITAITLLETTHPGLFRGGLALVSGVATNGQLRVQNGDTITARYFDVSGGSNATATASVDTVPPGITNVAATTDFYNARVTWKTSKPSDSAVQYGELTQPPANSVYASALVTNHSVTISGLVPNQIYHFQVVSRDQAGNTTVDDNGGNFYTFTTLKGLTPPWADNLESNAPGWSVAIAGESEINWTLGQPNNGLATSAHSGTNVWGSNLNGQEFILGETYLYSPPIDLSGMSEVTLKFWHNYDFSIGFQIGQLRISTNNSTPTLSLPILEDFTGFASDGWEEETFDLSAYSGTTVQIVWVYSGVSLSDIYDGWLVDDISVTGTIAGGNISITKNLEQGTWSLSSVSPIGLVPVQSGTASSGTLSNLPADNYVVQFGNVAFYQTPAAQTNALAVGTNLNFTGNYTFPDANNNGISDAFEFTYFGSVSTNRTQFTDSDGDKMSDYAEFIAGTIPTNAASNLRFIGSTLASNGVIQLQWTSVPDRSYRLHTTVSNFLNWLPAANWQTATGGVMTFAATNSHSPARLFRVEVRP